MSALELIENDMKGKSYRILANNGETYFVVSGNVNLYYIIRDGKIVDVQID